MTYNKLQRLAKSFGTEKNTYGYHVTLLYRFSLINAIYQTNECFKNHDSNFILSKVSLFRSNPFAQLPPAVIKPRQVHFLEYNIKTYPVMIQKRLISAELEPFLSYTQKPFIASYYR